MRQKRPNTSSDLTAAEARRILGFTGEMSPQALKAAFRAAAKAAQPGPGDPNSERLRRVIEAYQFLQDVGDAADGASVHDASASGRAGGPIAPGGDLHITLRESLFGLARSIVLGPDQKLGLRLPAGLRAGDLVRVPGQGASGADLYLKVIIDSPSSVEVMGDHLRIKVQVERHVLENGGRVDIDTPHGRHCIYAPKALPSNASVRVRGLGLPARGTRKAGDLFIKLEARAETVAKPTPARDLLRRFAQAWT